MIDDMFAGLEPGNSAGTGSTPPAPIEPLAPIEPPAPVASPAPDAPIEPSAEEQADADEWAKVAEDMFPGLGEPDNSKEENGEQSDTTKKPEEIGTDKSADEAPKPGEDAGKPNEDGTEETDDGTEKVPGQDAPTGPPELSASDRQQLEVAASAEVREKMFTEEVNGKQVVITPDGSKYFLDANGKPMLADADGDPIRGIDDLMQRINPRTGEAFTEEQAGMYLLNAQQRMRDNVADLNTRISEIASNGITMKEDSEAIAWEYGELLKAMPELQKELWGEYEKTLVKDPKTGIVIKAPSSLEKFYRIALEPYAALARRLDAENGMTPPAATPPAPATPDPAVQQQVVAEKRQQARQDRSDIYGGGKVDDATDDDKEWGSAAQAVFGDQLKDLRR